MPLSFLPTIILGIILLSFGISNKDMFLIPMGIFFTILPPALWLIITKEIKEPEELKPEDHLIC
jgi:hypothetical protein